MNEIKRRLKAPTPKFFKKLRAIGITIGSIGGAILGLVTLPIALPAAIITAAGYMVAVGTVTAVIAQSTEEKSPK